MDKNCSMGKVSSWCIDPELCKKAWEDFFKDNADIKCFLEGKKKEKIDKKVDAHCDEKILELIFSRFGNNTGQSSQEKKQSCTEKGDVGEENDYFSYEKLIEVFDEAYAQAASGKGKERHGIGLPFSQQPIMAISRFVGPGFPLGQAMKKASEVQTLCDLKGVKAAQDEILGAINYLAAAYLLFGEMTDKD